MARALLARYADRIRPDFRAAWLGHANTTHLTLSRMGAQDSMALVAAVLHSHALPRPQIEAIELPLGIAVARGISQNSRFTPLILVLLAIPLLIPWNVVGTIWQLYARPDIGLDRRLTGDEGAPGRGGLVQRLDHLGFVGPHDNFAARPPGAQCT